MLFRSEYSDKDFFQDIGEAVASNRISTNESRVIWSDFLEDTPPKTPHRETEEKEPESDQEGD